MAGLDNLTARQKEWEEGILKESLARSPEREISSELPKKRVYTPNDTADLDYMRDLGFPGDYPYTRGIHPTMYRSRIWGMAQYSGFGMPEDTNRRFKVLLATGQNGVSLACDMPTQLGYDPDNPLVESEVGVVGVACPSLKEVETIFDGIPMDRIRILGSTCHAHMMLWAMYMAAAEKQGISSDKLMGNVTSDCLQEFIARGVYIFSLKGAMRITVDFLEYAIKHLPKLNYQVNAYTVRESGATIVQEAAIALAVAGAYLEAARARGIDVEQVASRMAFNSAIHMNFFDEIAKFRALRRLWARTLKDKYGIKNPSSLRLSIGPGTGGSTFTAQDPENNIVRATVETMAAALGGVTYLHVAAYDEGHSIPTEKSALLALRTQQIVAYETGITDVVDPMGGSYFVETLTNEIERRVLGYLSEIEAHGGILKAIETGWIQQELARSAYQRQCEIDSGKQVVVGVNKFKSGEEPKLEIHRADNTVMKVMQARVKRMRQERNQAAVQQSLTELRKAAQGKDNLVPFVLNAVKSYATMGEICGVLKEVLGEYVPPAFVA
ncbi:MAG: methylmalonyl-CoA mutase [Chloroflexi bacterium]|nr:methylmalonyl-CoA mutase [Chloroflexota bacterium]